MSMPMISLSLFSLIKLCYTKALEQSSLVAGLDVKSSSEIMNPTPFTVTYHNESVLCIRWPKYWSFSFNISPSNEYSGLISFRMIWLDLLAVQGTLKNLLQHHSLKASILRRSAFFIVQLSHPYMTTGKNHSFD